MPMTLKSKAEGRAKAAEELEAFGGINLLHVKRQIGALLGLIGHGGIFDEYTKHDITHVNGMLEIYEWLIPQETQEKMSPADWLMSVLAVYFHDLGMLVTNAEFGKRAQSGFPDFCSEVLFAGDAGTDYKKRLESLEDGKRDRFLYEEFVRHNHASRVRNWIIGRQVDHLGVSHKVMGEVEKLLAPLDSQFRRDLALICESHHSDELGNLKIFKTSQPYGKSDAETANLQYAAILLRTADLLHITTDRTPSVEFRAISPSDPVSQQEWAKQLAVNRVRPKLGVNKDGLPDETAPQDTLEVHAYFTAPDGFFGLTSYLHYAQSQIAQSHEWAETARRRAAARHVFPWRQIDETNIETKGFIRETYEFTIDQARILDLLTGHTLYNDSRVVLRELVQNSLDAIRLQEKIEPGFRDGKIRICWDSKNRVLSVQDNGTGMTQEIIQKFLLTVGSSRYQDPEFKKKYPDFCAISRFGIGVLSCFMIADNVEVVTYHPEEEMAREISLRSVHGKYLIRLLDKETDALALGLKPHGTLFRLSIRPSVEVQDVLKTAREWIVVRGCLVEVEIDGGSPVTVGYESVKHALEAQLKEQGELAVHDGDGSSIEDLKHTVKIVERSCGGVSLAYAVEWDPWFHEWAYLEKRKLDNSDCLLLGTCVGGIRVEENTPGFDKKFIVAIANLSGPSCPRTNVARFGLENTPERDAALANIYQLYLGHLEDEMGCLESGHRYSLTWATQEAQYLIQPFFRSDSYRDDKPAMPLISSVFLAAARKVRFLVCEIDGSRERMAPEQLHKEPCFWTIDSCLCASVESLLRETAKDVSLRTISDVLTPGGIQLPSELILCTRSHGDALNSLIFDGKEIGKIVVYDEQRRVDLRWVNESNPCRWAKLRPKRLLNIFGDMPWVDVYIGRRDIECSVNTNITAIESHRRLYLMPGTPITDWLIEAIGESERTNSAEAGMRCIVIVQIASWLLRSSKTKVEKGKEGVSEVVRKINIELQLSGCRTEVAELIDTGRLYDVIEDTNWTLFTPRAWDRSQGAKGI